jgi:hypothetical protein
MKSIGSGSVMASGKALTAGHLWDAVPWDMLCTCVAETFRFTEAEKAAFRRNRTAQLIGALPFAAGCDEPERTALAHLAVYMTELRGGSGIGGHTPSDNAEPLTRLRLLTSFKGGNQVVIMHGMNKLALIMIEGYERSQAEDARRQVYNPLNDGSWNAEALKAALTQTLEVFPCEVLDGMLPDDSGTEPTDW